MGITLQQIADMAGTTKSTVDKVIHNRPGVSEKKRQEIKKLLEEQGYEANPLAKALNYQKRKMKVAVVLPNISAAPDIKKGFEIVRQDFQSFNIQVEYHEVGSSDAEAQTECIRKLAQDNVSGAVILPIRSESVTQAIQELLDKKIPVVIVNSELSLDNILCYVGQNMLQSGSVAARMLDLFRKKPANVGIISCHNMLSHEQRERSFIDSVEHNYPESRICTTRYIEETPEDAYRQTLEMLREAPAIDSIFITCGCVTDICRAIGDALGGASYYETEEKELQKHPFPLTKEECAIIGISTSSKKNTPNIYGMYEEEPKKIKNLVKKIAYESMNRYKILSEQVEDVNLREKYNELYKKSREIYEKLGGDNQKNVNLFNNL